MEYLWLLLEVAINETKHGNGGKNILLASRLEETLRWCFLIANLSLYLTILMPTMKKVTMSLHSHGKIPDKVFKASWNILSLLSLRVLPQCFLVEAFHLARNK